MNENESSFEEKFASFLSLKKIKPAAIRQYTLRIPTDQAERLETLASEQGMKEGDFLRAMIECMLGELSGGDFFSSAPNQDSVDARIERLEERLAEVEDLLDKSMCILRLNGLDQHGASETVAISQKNAEDVGEATVRPAQGLDTCFSTDPCRDTGASSAEDMGQEERGAGQRAVMKNTDSKKKQRKRKKGQGKR